MSVCMAIDMPMHDCPRYLAVTATISHAVATSAHAIIPAIATEPQHNDWLIFAAMGLFAAAVHRTPEPASAWSPRWQLWPDTTRQNLEYAVQCALACLLVFALLCCLVVLVNALLWPPCTVTTLVAERQDHGQDSDAVASTDAALLVNLRQWAQCRPGSLPNDVAQVPAPSQNPAI